MVKISEDYRKTKCAICWQDLKPKSPLLHGMKCIKYEIKEKLKYLLPLQDFNTLFDETIFSEPRLCNLCFVTVKKIPKTIARLQGLIGKKINIKLYKPQRSEWNVGACTQGLNKRTKLKTTQGYKFKSSEKDKAQQDEKISQLSPLKHKGIELCFSPEGLSHTFTSDKTNDDSDDEDTDEEFDAGLDKAMEDVVPSHSNGISAQNKDYKNLLMFDDSEIAELNLSGLADAFLDTEQIKVENKPVAHLDVTASASNDKNNVILSTKSDKALKSKPRRESKRAAAIKAKRKKFTAHESESDSGLNSDISIQDSEDEYLPTSGKVRKLESTATSNDDSDNKRTPKSKTVSPRKTKIIPGRSRAKGKLLPQGKKFNVCNNSDEELNSEADSQIKVENNSLQVDIPANLSDESKKKLATLIQKAEKYVKKNKKPGQDKLLIKCCISNCDHGYPTWQHMAVHFKYYHYDGILSTEDDFSQKMAMLANNGGLDNELFSFKCTHKGCKLAFTTEENLNEHQSAHSSEHVYMCEFPDCTKAFKLSRALHTHLRSHTGERPFTCDIHGCGKSFKDSKDLVKHKSRHTGDKPHRCEFEGCTKTFFTASEKNSHNVTHMKADMLSCEICGKQYAHEKGLTRHKRRIHGVGKPGLHKCPYSGCEESFVKKEKLEIHICSHSPERQLFCEKCGKKFSCQRYLDVHYKIHLKNEKHAANPPQRTVACEYPGCGKLFTTRENMKSHLLNQHRGRKPKSVPGVFFSCSVEGCGKQFSFRSTLYRHNKLVHKGGDYKLGKEFVKHPCKYDGCFKEFNRKNLLEEHMVMEHGKTPKRLLPLQNKELDFIERICVHCGMVLTVAQLPRHVEVYHSERALREMKETSPYPCHLKGCDYLFNALEDRKFHVQQHIDNPPYRCQVGDCCETFYLEKNLDNHLWNHNRKQSTCDFEGCYKVFDDQLLLAKHSRVHYDPKMKCPWPNCDNWLTETGQLKPHFIAHSRSLRANLDCDFVCEICELAFNSKWGLMIHKRLHGDDAAAKPSLARLARFSCEEPGCQGTFSDQKGFFDHFLYHYTNIHVMCDYMGCQQTFHNMITMSRHTKCHYDGKFKCPWQGCGKYLASVFIVKQHLYRHIMSEPSISINREYHCNQCFMVFRLQENLASHQEDHNEKSDYVCPTCGKKGRHNHLTAQKLGKPRKSQVCQQCGARYSTMNGLKFHQLQKHKIGKWPFKCDYCGKGFVSSREMQRHTPSHTKEKPFVCEICTVSFASHTGHRAHMRKHSGQKYVCDVEGCGKVYTTPISLRGHKAQHEGFSKMCQFCGKTYKNPYGHKCKASRDIRKTKQVINQQMGQPVTLPVTVLPQTVQPHLQTPQPQIIQVQTPSTFQHTVIIPQQLVPQNMDMQQGQRNIMTSSTLTHQEVIQHNLSQVIPQGLQQPGLHHTLANQNLMQDRNQQMAMDMARVNTMDDTGNYPFNNYVVFWDSQNL
ncbi:zinc finger protein 91-like isoform X2 [Physella acuta]|nr:zinc finger protein 91-like isoform X2 [Physella acuta]XP_059146264.1 zinc finger protein 91-like isoform X2 [Physella acuta]XP_059146266.1 zinc finger protein 91-like isoform X2 [Physella acuta]